MATLKTQENDANVSKFLNTLEDNKKQESTEILNILQKSTNAEPKMWGASIVGFGMEHLVYESGRELDWFKVGFSPRKQNLTLYGLNVSDPKQADLFSKLGKFTVGKGCLYIKKLADVDLKVLEEIVKYNVKP